MNVGVGADNLTVEALQAQGQPVPPIQPCTALVDTGASGLALDTSIVRGLSLKRQGVVTNHTAGGMRQANTYLVSLTFPGSNLRSYSVVLATEVVLTTQPFKVLIGREIMRNWHVHYNGQSGFVSIAD